MLLILSIAAAGTSLSSWSTGTVDYPDESYTPPETSAWSTSPDLDGDAVISGWAVSWLDGQEVMAFSGLEDGSYCEVEDERSYGPVLDPRGPMVGWGWAAAVADDPGQPLALESMSVIAALTGDGTVSWSAATGWANGAQGPAQPEMPPAGSPWSLVASDGDGQGVSLASDRLSWQVDADGLALVQLDIGGVFDYGSTVTITWTWLAGVTP